MKKNAPPSKRNSALSKQRLLDAAIDVFSLHGYEAATTRMVAKKAGLNAALIARYFGNKHGLFHALADHHRATLVAQSLPTPPLANLQDELLRYFEFRLMGIQLTTKTFRVILGHAFTNNAGKNTLKRNPGQFTDPALFERLQLLKDTGALGAEVDVAALSKVILTYLSGHVLVNFMIFDRTKEQILDESRTFLSLLQPAPTKPTPKR
jgi:AcrR family transcriptional regulator